MRNNEYEHPERILKIDQEIAEHYISLNLKKNIVITRDKWETICDIMEDGCREVLNDLTHEILEQMQSENEIDISRN